MIMNINSQPEAIVSLIRAAADVRRHAYAPYSHFFVGAALLTADGTVFAGCNVENASYGLTLCAERSACAGAIAAGKRAFTAMAIVSDGAVTPCGACRQFLMELAPDMTVIVSDAQRNDMVKVFRVAELLPESFSAKALQGCQEKPKS